MIRDMIEFVLDWVKAALCWVADGVRNVTEWLERHHALTEVVEICELLGLELLLVIKQSLVVKEVRC